MGRRPRIEFKGAIFHVIKRGNNREYIFKTEEDKEYFLTYLDRTNVDGIFDLFGYVIMDNHYHLIIGTKEKSLDKIMHLAVGIRLSWWKMMPICYPYYVMFTKIL